MHIPRSHPTSLVAFAVVRPLPSDSTPLDSPTLLLIPCLPYLPRSLALHHKHRNSTLLCSDIRVCLRNNLWVLSSVVHAGRSDLAHLVSEQARAEYGEEGATWSS